MSLRSKFTAIAAAAALTAAGLLTPPSAAAEPAVNAAAHDPNDGVTRAQNGRVPAGAIWTEAYFPSRLNSNGKPVELHADVLRPTNAGNARTPVIMSVGPYFSHAGQTGDDGFSQTGPSERFNDLIDGARLMERGYTVVLVDLRGFGGSTGCLDWMGPGEQADVASAVEWAAAQPWTNGKVGLYGKSYDASTGLIGAVNRPRGLGAIVAQEPVWNPYTYLYSNRVPRPNVVGTPAVYNQIAQIPPMRDDTARYRSNAEYEKSNPECTRNNSRDTQQNTRLSDRYWADRNLAAKVAGSTVPLFSTQGFTESNTKPEDMQLYLTNHKGAQRGWLGPWEHVRGNDRDANGNLEMGRSGWFTEVMAFYDQYLKGTTPSTQYPAYAIQNNFGKWRAQATWPSAATARTVNLRAGTYVDQRSNSQAREQLSTKRDSEGRRFGDTEYRGDIEPQANAAALSNVITTKSRPVQKDTRLTATPRVTLTTSGQRNVQVRLWDVDAQGNAVLIDENVAVLDSSGTTTFDLKSLDWTLAAGRSLGVSVGSVRGFWSPSTTGQTVTVRSARLNLAIQSPAGDRATAGNRAPELTRYINENTARNAFSAGGGDFDLAVG